MEFIQSLKGVQTIKIHFDEIVFVSEKLNYRKAQKGDLATCMGDWEIGTISGGVSHNLGELAYYMVMHILSDVILLHCICSTQQSLFPVKTAWQFPFHFFAKYFACNSALLILCITSVICAHPCLPRATILGICTLCQFWGWGSMGQEFAYLRATPSLWHTRMLFASKSRYGGFYKRGPAVYYSLT